MSHAARVSRRRFLATSAGLVPLFAAGSRPARAQGSLKGTKLTILASDWYVPENNKQLDELAAQVSKDTGMEVKVERFTLEQQVAKIAATVGTGSGADLAIARDFDAYLYGPKLVDVTSFAEEIGRAWGGWYDVAQQACVVNGRWRALMIGQAPAAWNYRTDMFKAAGVEKFPDTFDELLAAAKKLHAKGTPIGMTLGHASGDGRSTNFPVLWAFGGKEFDKDGKTVTLNSPETLRAVEWYAETYKYMDPGVTAWLDPDNNQAFLAGKISATVNVNTIYLASRAAAATDPARKTLIENMDHANWPAGPAGRFAQYNVNVWVAFESSKNRAGQLAFLRAWHDKSFLGKWTKTGQSYFIPAFKGLETMDVWPDDPKLKIFRELNKLNRLPGYAGPPTPAAAEAVNKHVIVDMFAKACTGQLKPKDAVAWATKEYEQIAKKRSA
jgi:multiple sugar transport system substrate-binding protein